MSVIPLSMKQYEIRVTGKVQQAGYRDIVRDAAMELGYTGYVENLRDYTVKIVCVGPEENLDDFLKRIRVTNRLINVKDITINESEPTEHFDNFFIKRGDMTEELGERLDTAIFLFKDMRDEISDMRKEMRTGFNEVKEEVSEVKKEVSEVKKEVLNMHIGMDKNFNHLDGKYHSVTKELKKIRKAIIKGLNLEEDEID